MTLKKKIIITSIAAVLIIAVAIVGVLAATSQQVEFRSSIQFNAQHVNANVNVKAYHTSPIRSGGALSDVSSFPGITPSTLAADSTTSGFGSHGIYGQDDIQEYSFSDTEDREATIGFDHITFDETNNAVLFTVTIENKGESISVKLYGNGSGENYTVLERHKFSTNEYGDALDINDSDEDDPIAYIPTGSTLYVQIYVAVTDLSASSIDNTSLTWTFVLNNANISSSSLS